VPFLSFLPFSDEQLQELANKFPRIAVTRGKAPPRPRWAKPGEPDPEPPWEVVFRAPTSGESDAFEGAANDDRQKPAALRTLAKATVIGVSYRGIQAIHDGERKGKAEKEVRSAWDKLRDDYPAAHIAAQEDLQQLLGSQREEMGKD
jgi:hypothetical protein